MRILLLCSFLFLIDNSLNAAGIPLTITPGDRGPNALVVAGQNYLDTGVPSVDGIVLKDKSGKTNKSNTQGIFSIDAATKVVTSKFEWGTIGYRYRPGPSALGITITVHNTTDRTITELRLTPLILRLPASPAEYNGNTPLLVNSIGAPAVTSLSTSGMRVTLVDEDVQHPLLLGFPWSMDKPKNTRFPIRLTVGRDSMYPDSLPMIYRPIAPGGTDQFQISVRFSSPKDSPEVVAKDVYTKFATVFPLQLTWPDRRPIASLMMATSNTGWIANPRGWFLDSNLDVIGPLGDDRFRDRLLQWADDSIGVMRSMKAQGMITWDVEGEQFAHPITYIGDPRVVDMLAPEMAHVVDEYFRKFRAAGFRVGVTVRPQQLTKSDQGYVQQAVQNPTQLLIEKVRYAKKRWGASLFYVDSNGDANAPIDASVFEAVLKAVPGILLIPEQKTVRYSASTAPYYELRKSVASTPPAAKNVYPRAFSVINTEDGDIAKYRQQLVDAIRGGDILLFRGWYNDAPNEQILKLYRSSR